MEVVIVLISCVAFATGAFDDEMQSYEPECLSEGAFFCVSGGCILQGQYCDGRYDCADGSDENLCENHTPDAMACSEAHQFLCRDGKRCVPSSWVCNSEPDCNDGSDEANCTAFVVAPNATCHGFACDGGKTCISRLWTCDGKYDCKDESDEDVEKTCRHALRPHVVNDGVNCGDDYQCLDSSFCIAPQLMCDGMKDCRDGSDEGAFCATWHSVCLNFTCKDEAKCKPQRSGPACVCPGHTYQQYNYTTHQCRDVNDCLHERPMCSHICMNGYNNFNCDCEEGYILDRLGYLCYAPAPEAMLFFSTRNDIRYVKVTTKQQFVVATGIKQAHGVSYDGTYIYWVETAQGHQSIVRATMDKPNNKQVLVSLGLEEPGDIAVDWMGGNIYFSDAERGVISVCRADGAYCATVNATTKHPRFVTLDAKRGNMYWADWREKPVIMHGKLDGSHCGVLAGELYTFASGLAVDAPNDRLYFVDRTIKVVKLDDGKIYSLFEERFHHPYSIAVFENTVYWSDWTSNMVLTVDKLHSIAEKRNVLVTLDMPVFDMHIYHPVLMNRSANPCKQAACSHFCFVTSRTSYTCGCPDGMERSGNQCLQPHDYRQQYLIVGAGSSFTRWQYDRLGTPGAHATIFNIGRVQAMAYDSLRDKLYVFDGYRECVQSIDMRDFGTGVAHLFLQDGRRYVVDMDYDYVSDTLYVLDAGRRLVEAVSLRTKDTALVYVFRDEEVPISFCVVPEYGRMLVALDEKELNNEIHVDSIGLDGSDRRHLMMTNLRGPHVRLRYSQHMDVVYVSDEGTGVIDSVHPEGTGRDTFRELSTTIGSLAVTDNQVFWTDRRTSRLFWADLHEANHRIRRIELGIFPNNSQLHILATTPPPDPKNPLLKHRCFQNQLNPCPELCVQVPHDHPHQATFDMGYKCLCSSGRILVNGMCVQLKNCKHDELFCHKSNGCFSKDRKCDGHRDCQFGEDEEGCPVPISRSSECSVGQKLCRGACIDSSMSCLPDTAIQVPMTCSASEHLCVKDGICIERTLACDGRADCPDGSDEDPAACVTLACFETEFMCASGSCISNAWRCDSSEDCIDGSDELNCANKTCGFGYYQCRSGECVELLKRCNRQFDCTDHTDEEDCDRPEDAEVDCPGNSDEDGCDTRCAPLGMFACRQEVRCLIRRMVCNGANDCVDGSDETPEACAVVNKTSRLFTNHVLVECHNGFQCTSGQCVEWAAVCNGVNDCLDGSDEHGQCSTLCPEHHCSHECNRSPLGPRCACPRGYRMHQDGRNCVDVDECEADVCSQNCLNTPGSFICSCHLGYALRSDRRSCKAIRGNMSVLFVSANSVKSIFADYKVSLEYNDPTIARISDLDYNVRTNQLYIASADTGKLIEANRTGNDQGVNVVTNIGRPTRVAVDWVTGNVYFVDSKPGQRCIRVCNVRRRRCTQLQNLPSDADVTALVLDPAAHMMFYCVNRELESVVRSASLSGWESNDLATLTNCTGLEVDSFKRRLYVAETGTSRILSMDYEGNNSKVMFSNDPNLQAPHGLALFEDSIYFLAANTFKLSRCHLHTKRCEPYLYSVFDANTFVLRHESVQRNDVEDKCAGVSCAGVCVLASSGATCLCANGELSPQGTCPLLSKDVLPRFNGWTQRDVERANSVSFTVTAVVLALLMVYLAIFAYYYVVRHRRRRALDYIQVRYQTTPVGMARLSNATIEMPNAGGITHEFANPLQALMQWRSSTRRPVRPHGAANVLLDSSTSQQDSDTESEIDVSEKRRILR